MQLVRVAREERDVRRERGVLGDDPAPVPAFLLENIADEVAARLVEMLLRQRQFARNARRDERVSVDLAVRVMERNADRLALVLEDEDVSDEVELRKLGVAVGPDADELVDLLNRLGRERRRVIRRVDHDLALAGGRRDRVEITPLDRRFARGFRWCG